MLLRRKKNGELIELNIDYDRLGPSKSLRALMEEQRKKLEQRGEGLFHCDRHKAVHVPHSTTLAHINAPLDAGRVRFNSKLQQEIFDHSGIYFLDDIELEQRVPRDLDMQKSLAGEVHDLEWTINPPLKYFQDWSGKVQHKAFNCQANQRGPGSRWHRDWREKFFGEQMIGYQVCDERQFDRNVVHCVFTHWARICNQVYYHDTLANATEPSIGMQFEIGSRKLIGLQEKYSGAGKECMGLVAPLRAKLHKCKTMALHAMNWYLVPFYERFGYVTKWGLVYEKIYDQHEINDEEEFWNDDQTTNHYDNIYMARLVL